MKDNKVDSFNEKEIKIILKDCPKLVRDYVDAQNRVIDSRIKIMAIAQKKINELSSELQEARGELNDVTRSGMKDNKEVTKDPWLAIESLTRVVKTQIDMNELLTSDDRGSDHYHQWMNEYSTGLDNELKKLQAWNEKKN